MEQKEHDPMNPLHWNREQWKNAVQGLVLVTVAFTEFYFVIAIFG